MAQQRVPHLNEFSKETQDIVYKILAKAAIRRMKAEAEQKNQKVAQ